MYPRDNRQLPLLGQVFSSAEAYLEKMKQAPYLHPWTPAVENYCRYEIEKFDGGVRTNIYSAHIQEEAANIRKVDCASFYPAVRCKVLILRATNGLFSQDDLLSPEDVINKMTDEMSDVRRFDVGGTNHYGIVMQPHEARDEVIHEFLKA